ncbi:hypothetical protein [Aliiroseovarius sp. xm-v-208]|uniref:hypothetical protein n=1 Tax=Aliiroseovarius sp. xm-v-208 TaxID=2651835 RepID=UPI001569F673|nr:hypothetical protein [Aliiroseovarius sp. xm-v-208]NRQ09440.1 hypothetical protein [Aliiroseovarius sp. xm-v-208]
METKVMTNMLHALGGYDPEKLDKEFFNEEVPERNCWDDDDEDEELFDLPNFPDGGRKAQSDDDIEILMLRPGRNQAENSVDVNSQNTTIKAEGILRPHEEEASSDQRDVDAVDQFLKSLTDDDDDDEEDDLDFQLSCIDDCDYFADGPFKGNRTLELIDLLVRMALSYAAKHGYVDQDGFKRLYYRIDFLKFSMFNEVTPDDLLGFKFLSGLISYDEYDERLKDWERLHRE